jgi:hypothetical protein
MEDELAPGAGRIDALGQGAKADAALLEVGDLLNEVAQRATQTIESPDDQRIAGTDEVESFRWAEGERPRSIAYATIAQ